MSWKEPESLRETVTTIITEMMEKDNELDIWDARPELMLILNPGKEDDKLRVAMLDFSPDIWSVAPTAQMVETIGKALLHPEAPKPKWPIEPGDVILGVIIRVEGWVLAGRKPPGGLEGEAKKEWAKQQEAELTSMMMGVGGRIVNHPQAIEVKSYCVTLGTGDSLSYNSYRKPKYDELQPPEDGITEGADGALFDALQLVLKGAKTLETPE